MTCKWGENISELRNSSAWLCMYKIPLSMTAKVNQVNYTKMQINECLCTENKCRCYEEEIDG